MERFSGRRIKIASFHDCRDWGAPTILDGTRSTNELRQDDHQNKKRYAPTHTPAQKSLVGRWVSNSRSFGQLRMNPNDSGKFNRTPEHKTQTHSTLATDFFNPNSVGHKHLLFSTFTARPHMYAVRLWGTMRYRLPTHAFFAHVSFLRLTCSSRRPVPLY